MISPLNQPACLLFFFFFSSRRRHTRLQGDWSSDVCSSDLEDPLDDPALHAHDGAVGQERVDEHPVATDRVHAEDQRQAGPPLAPDESEPAGLGLGDAPFAPAPAPAKRLAPGLRLLTRAPVAPDAREVAARRRRSEEHTSELQSPCNLVCRLLLEKKKKKTYAHI